MTEEQKTAREADRKAEALVGREVLACVSSLVESAMGQSYEGEAFCEFQPECLTNSTRLVCDECGEHLESEELPEVLTFECMECREQYTALEMHANGGQCPECEHVVPLSEIDKESVQCDQCPHCKSFTAGVEHEPVEVFEWWIVTGWFADKLMEHGECMFERPDGMNHFWGRTTTGQSISMDYVVREISKEVNA